MKSSSERRAPSSSGVNFDTAASVLAVGGRTAVLEDVFDRTEVLQTYFDLVTEQRHDHPLAVRTDLRDRDLVSLAAILDLPPDELERYITRELTRFIANPHGHTESAVYAPVAPAAATHHIRRLLILLVVGVALVVTTAVVTLALNPDPAPATQAAGPVATVAPVAAVPVAPAEPVATPAPVSGPTSRLEPDPDGTGEILITETAPVAGDAAGTEIVGAEQIVHQP
jgi:hypothetical protein